MTKNQTDNCQKRFVTKIKNGILRKCIGGVYLYVFAIDGNTHAQKQVVETDSLSFGATRLSKLRGSFQNLKLEMVVPGDEESIDQLTSIDPWNISKSASLNKLDEGWLCYVVRAEDKIVASTWAYTGENFFDDFLKREFKLAEHEVYLWRGYTERSARGKGVAAWGIKNVLRELNQAHCKTRYITIVRAENRAIQRMLRKMGWKLVGFTGFFEMLGIRFHYLYGRTAFERTTKRLFIQWTRKWSLVRLMNKWCLLLKGAILQLFIIGPFLSGIVE